MLRIKKILVIFFMLIIALSLGTGLVFAQDGIISGSYYKLVAKHSGKCLDVSGVSNDNGAAVIQWDWLGGDNQQWLMISES